MYSLQMSLSIRFNCVTQIDSVYQVQIRFEFHPNILIVYDVRVSSRGVSYVSSYKILLDYKILESLICLVSNNNLQKMNSYLSV